MAGVTAITHFNFRSSNKLKFDTCIFALAVAILPSAVQAQDGGPESIRPAGNQFALNVAQNIPQGFEDIDNSVETLFDIYLSGQRLGTSPARVEDGEITFLDPDGLLQLLPDRVDRAKVLLLLQQQLSSNESERCLPGRTANCGVLPGGQNGVVVNTERFSLEIFLTPDYYLETPESELYLSDPESGPSLIQTVLASVSSGNDSGAGVTFGATLDTLASVGRTSFVGQTLVRDSGANIQRAFVQHFWRKRSAAAGLLQQGTALTLNSYRLVGAQYGTFFGARRDVSDGLQTPIELLLPRSAQVEVYRDNVLIQASRFDAGVQRINTSNFPAGSYPVRIIAKDGDQILVDETRVFTKATDLPPLGEWAYNFRAGLRVSDVESVGTNVQDTQPFFPGVSSDPIVSASLSRQVVPGIGVSGEIFAVRDNVYAEASVIGYRGKLRGVAASAVGSDGSYSVFANFNAQVGKFDLSLVGRHTRVKNSLIAPSIDEFEPFYRSEDTILGGINFPLAGGNLSLNGSYSQTPEFDDRYTVSARYSKSVDVGSLGSARISAFGLKSNTDLRVGVSMTFLNRIDRKTIATYSAGAEYRKRNEPGETVSEAYPIADARISRQERFGSFDVSNQIGLSTDSDRRRAFASSTVASNYGTFDVTANYEDRRGPADGTFGVSGNMFTGIVVGGGEVKLGMRQAGGDAALLVKVETPEDIDDRGGDASGRYRILVGNQYIGAVEPGKTSALGAQAFSEYRIGLAPEGSPRYDIDLSSKRVALYPGNVAVVKYQAQRVITIFGRVLDADGKPIRFARVSGMSDVATTDDLGYFVYSAKSDENVDFYNADNKICFTQSMKDVLVTAKKASSNDYIKIGDVRCAEQ